MARPERFELPTAWFVARYSIQLSYGRVEARDYPLEAAKTQGLSRKLGRDGNTLNRAGSGLIRRRAPHPCGAPYGVLRGGTARHKKAP